MQIIVYDLECYPNFFSYTGIDRDSKKKYQYVIHTSRNDINELLEHLESGIAQVGFNNLYYDYQVLDWILKNKDLSRRLTPQELTGFLYEESSRLINDRNSCNIERNPKIPQCDLFLINHYGNKARMTSLKKLEIAMRLNNVEDLPFEPGYWVQKENIQDILDYNEWDVIATMEFYKRCTKQIQLRRKLENTYNIPLINRPDVGIAEDLFLHSYCKLTRKSKWGVRKLRTLRSEIWMKDVVLPVVRFLGDKMKKWYEGFRLTRINISSPYTTATDWEEETLAIGNEHYQIGLGGIHIIQKPGVYKAAEDEYIAEWDVSSMYPRIIAEWGFYPKHLGEEFLTLYKQILENRLKAKAEGDHVMNATGKLMLNGTFGKFGSDESYLYDLLMLYRTTINNQLFILMLLEECENNDFKVISANTDSITIHIKKDRIADFKEIVSWWEKLTKHTLEETEYSKICYRDVNNYVGITTSGNIKRKGAYVTDPEFHKDVSMLIVKKAVSKYFIEDIPVEHTIKECTDIYDFCLSKKTNRGWHFEQTILGNNGEIIVKHPKNIRYIITKDPIYGYMFKIEDTGKTSQINKGYGVQVVNKIDENKPISEYRINYSFYISEAYKLVHAIDSGQLSLF